VIDAFLRRPVGPAAVLADVIRLTTLVSVIVVGVGWGFVEVALFALVLGGLVVVRMLALHPTVDLAVSLTLLVAAWSSALDLYTSVAGWDLVVHAALNGLLALAFMALLQRVALLPALDASRFPRATWLVLTTAIGLAAGVVWEIAEWAGNAFLDPTIYVGYTDTISDLAIGGGGALVAAIATSSRFDRARSR
jgi:pimeloyl-ACP methyl ester carboxylesterase